MSRVRLSPWEKIMRAAYSGTSLRLTADEVYELSRDGAISTAAGNFAYERTGSETFPAYLEGTIQSGR